MPWARGPSLLDGGTSSVALIPHRSGWHCQRTLGLVAVGVSSRDKKASQGGVTDLKNKKPPFPDAMSLRTASSQDLLEIRGKPLGEVLKS